MEADAQELRREQHEFDSASVSYPVRRPVGIQFALTGHGAAQLNAGGAEPTPFGPIKQLAVGRGDTLTVTAHGLYLEPARHPSWVLSLAGYVAGLLQAQPAGPLPSDGKGRVRVWPLLNIGLPLAGVVPQLAGGVPRAYLRVLVFNKDSVLTDTRTQQLTQAALGTYEPLQISLVVPEAGYATAYVATESEADVFFDDIYVEHGQGLQVQETHYDPYGVELAGLSTSSHGLKQLNQYTWNGKEKQTEFGLNWQDHGWRFYDPTIGRWVVVDPDAEEGDQEGWTTYQFGLDNAVRYNDLDGRMAGPGDSDPIGTITSFISGAMAAYADNGSGGAVNMRGRMHYSNATAYNMGQTFGDVASVVQGGAELLQGGSGLVGSAALEVVSGGIATPVAGAGALVSAATMAHGGMMGGRGLANLASNNGRVNANGSSNPGRSGKQSRLKELGNDPKVSKADRGWIKNEQRHIANGDRKTIRLPGNSRNSKGPGKVLAHPRGQRAKDGHSYKNAKLQDTDLHKLEHKHGGYK